MMLRQAQQPNEELKNQKYMKKLQTLTAIFTLAISITTSCKKDPEPNNGTTDPVVVLVTSVTLSDTIATQAIGDNLILTATVLPDSATNKAVTWTSSDTTVAKVNNGTVTTLKAGTANITVITEDGNKTATCSLTVVALFPPVAVSTCNNDTTGWRTKFGEVSFVSSQTWIVGSQEWSDVVQATNCNKTTFSGGSSGNYASDCRSNPGQLGDLFSWCAVVRFKATLCPDGWRVPTTQDFVNLDIALGGTGGARDDKLQFIYDTYLNYTVWGGAFSGICYENGSLGAQGTSADYWSESPYNASNGFCLRVTTSLAGFVGPQNWGRKDFGFMLRCVK
jgi:uncharacterized protein (TIGR02145 family)